MAPMQAPRGSFIAFSTAEGDVAYDGRGNYSPFAEAFAGEIRTPDITINSMMIRVNAKVDELTSDLGSAEQVPWARYSLKEDFFFNKRAASPQPAGGAVVTAPPRGKTREERESELWDDIKDSRDPDEFAVFLKRYPDGAHAELAKIRQAKFSEPAPAQKATKVATQPTSTQAGGGGQPAAAERGVDPDMAALCRQFAAGDSASFADCIAEMNEDNGDTFAMEMPDYQAGGYPDAGIDPSMMGDQSMTTTAVWHDNEFNQWQVIVVGDNFTASSFLPGSGPISLQGQSQGYGVSYGIFDANGLQIGYGQGTISDASHINVTSYWSNGAILGSTTFHVNHPPQ